MARIRTIKPEMWESEDLAEVTLQAHLTLVGMISNADDDGRLKATPRHLKGAIYPLREDVSLTDVERWMWELEAAGLIDVYGQSATRQFVAVKNFKKHQTINRYTQSKLPQLGSRCPKVQNPLFAGHSLHAHDALTEGSRQEGNGREWKGVTTTAPDARPSPTDTLTQAAQIAVAAMDKPNLLDIWVEQIVMHHDSRTIPPIAYLDAALDLAVKLRDTDSGLTVSAGNWAFYTKLVSKHQALLKLAATNDAPPVSKDEAFAAAELARFQEATGVEA